MDPPRSTQHSNRTPIRVSTHRALALRGLARSNQSVIRVCSRSLPAHDRSVHPTRKAGTPLVFSTKTVSKGRKMAVALAVAASALTTTAAATATPNDGGRLSLVAYSTPRDAYAALIPAFEATPAGNGISFSQSFGASGSQSRAVAAGLPADVVNLSLAPDVDSLVKAGFVSPSWN